jgi:hypothetical protein
MVITICNAACGNGVDKNRIMPEFLVITAAGLEAVTVSCSSTAIFLIAVTNDPGVFIGRGYIVGTT